MDPQLGSSDPLQLNSILKLVLEHVGKTDLKNCRLVNHSWNRIAVQVLEQRGFAVQLNIDKVAEFKSLLWRTQLSSRMNCGQLELASLILSVNLFPNKYSEHSTEVAKVIQFLLLHPQLRLAFIKFDYEENRNFGQGQGEATQPSWTILANHELFNLLKLASPDLIDLTFCPSYNTIPLRFEDFVFGSYLELAFPRLNSLRYDLIQGGAKDPEIMDMTKHVVCVIRRANKLTKLKLNLSEGDYNKSTIIIGTMMRDCSTQLIDLEVEGRYPGLTVVLSRYKFPSLTTFKITNGMYNFSKEFNHFLKNNCPSLRSITMYWDTAIIDMRHIHQKEDFEFEFPYLPQLLHFGYFPYHWIEPNILETLPLAYTAIMTKLPSLRSLSIDLGVLFLLGADFHTSSQLVPPPPPPPPRDEYPTFPTLSTLEVRITCPQVGMPGGDEELGSALQVYQKSFPNLSTLKIKVVGAIKSEQEVIRCIEFLCSHNSRPGFQHLEIRNKSYTEDPEDVNGWLLLSQMSKINQEQLKSLKLFPSRPPTPPSPLSRRAGSSSEVGAFGTGNELSRILARYPSLEFFQFGEQEISHREIETVKEASKIVGRFGMILGAGAATAVDAVAAAPLPH